MKLKELLKIDTTKTNWYKVFDKHGINPKTIKAINNGELEGDVNKKYGYYLISPDIFDIVGEGRIELLDLILGVIGLVKNCELNGRTSFSRGAGEYGIDAYVNTPITIVIGNLITNQQSKLPYCAREYFNMGMMVDESDMNYLVFVNGNKLDVLFNGTLLERLELLGMVDVMPYFIPITKEEYENLSSEFKD